MSNDLVMTEHKCGVSPKEYNVLLAQCAARIANALIIKDSPNPVKDSVSLGKELLERSGIVAVVPQAAAPAAQ